MEPPPLRTARELSFRIHSNTWKLRGITRTKNPSIIRDTHPDECDQFRVYWHEKNNSLKYKLITREYTRYD